MTADRSDTTLVQEITINAPAAIVFAALTDPNQLPQWWGDEQTYRCTHMENDLRVGGGWRTDGVSSDGGTFTVGGEYLAIDPPRLLEYTWDPSFGTPHDAKTVVHIELTETGGVTRLHLTHSGFSSPESRDQHDAGWTKVLGWLKGFAE